MIKVIVRLIEDSAVNHADDSNWNYVFQQVSFSSDKPWLPNLVTIRSLEKLDFEYNKDYVLKIETE